MKNRKLMQVPRRVRAIREELLRLDVAMVVAGYDEGPLMPYVREAWTCLGEGLAALGEKV